MMQEIVGPAYVNVAHEIGVIDGFVGAIAVMVENEGNVPVNISFAKETALTDPLVTDQDTSVAAEATGYTGNASTLNFSGQSLDHLPITPKTVYVYPTAGGNTVDATDKDGDGKLYTYDVDEDECGSINYATGALVLRYPTGKDPNTGAIRANYDYSVAAVPKGVRMYRINNVRPGERIRVYATATTATGSIPTGQMRETVVHVGVFGLSS